MPRPRSLQPADIANAAIHIVDHEGLATLSMRTVAAELGVGAMSLYRYVKDRDALERLVVDQVLSAVEIESTARVPWDRQVIHLAERMRNAVGAHPSITPLLMLHRHASPEVLRCTEMFLQALTKGGFAGQRRVIALRALVSYLMGALQAQYLGPLAGSGTKRMADLPNTYPLLAETARDAQHVQPDEEFYGGLAILLQGLAYKL